MKFNLLYFIAFFSIATVSAQQSKPVIDSAAIHHWISLDYNNVAISNNGHYVVYGIKNEPTSNKTLVIQSTEDSWQKKIVGATKVMFSSDNKWFVYKQKDTLCFLELGKYRSRKILGVGSVKVPPSGSGEWLAWQMKEGRQDMVLYNFTTGKEDYYNDVTSYMFSDNGRVLLFQTGVKTVYGTTRTKFKWMGLQERKVEEIYEGDNIVINSIATDETGMQTAFMVHELGKVETQARGYQLWYFREGMSSAVLKAMDTTSGIKTGLFINPPVKFSSSGNYIYFTLKKLEGLSPIVGGVKVNVWNYKDAVIHSRQNPFAPSYIAVVKTGDRPGNKIVQLTRENEIIFGEPKKADYALLRYDTTGDRFWMKSKWGNYQLISLADGTRQLLLAKGQTDVFSFSPNGNWLLYYSTAQQHYFTYNFKTGRTVNITQNLLAGQFGAKEDFNGGKYLSGSAGIAGWLDEDEGVLVYDSYDLWLLDPSGNKIPRNITHGYGFSKKIKFSLITTIEEKNHGIVNKADRILVAFNIRNKYNGFYSISLDKDGGPSLLKMDRCTFFHTGRQLPANQNNFLQEMEPLKAKDANAWILMRHSSDDAPNYFVTNDFKSYRALTNLQPQKQYNWLKSELISWIQFDGTKSQGVLYKPEDFDSHKKYPLIINYYEQLSHRLYQYPFPYFTGSAHIDIAWFVSRGYLVFTPDIFFTKNNDGMSVYNTVVSAAKYLSKFSYIDGKKMAISGHSFAGGLTNYLVTHTSLFAAAFVGAGTSDLISSSFQAEGDRLGLFEVHIGHSLWQSKSLVLKNTPILQADKVTTPLLMFHCRQDGGVPWEQAMEMFIALRRLDKKVWLIEYDDGNHSVDGNNAEDLTIRVTQFFDHYLKGESAPRWMVAGIPLRSKGIDYGLEIDDINDKH